jgi:hypothetical protein
MSLFSPRQAFFLPAVALVALGASLLASCSVQAPAAAQAPLQVAEKQAPAVASAVTSELTYTAKGGDSTTSLARKFLTQSNLMTVAELDRAIRQRNLIKGSLKSGQQVVIPTLEPQPVVEKSRHPQKEADVRAIYLTGNTAGSNFGLELVRRWKQSGGNAVVFDIKDSDGSLSIAFDHPLAPKRRPLISNLSKYIRYLHSQDMHVIARIALFRDDHIAQKHSRLAVQSRATGQPWSENGKQVWTDPSNQEVQQYNLALAKFVAASGVDEVQFDYVRFPAEGNQSDAKFAFEGSPTKLTRANVIANFLQQAYAELHPTGALLSLDVFGVMAWQRSVDLAHTGQDIAEMAKHCDVLSPMIYPSHFFGMDGYALPGDAPEHFIATSMDRFRKITAGTGVVLRPWLQAFAWKTKTYSPEYIKTQVLVSKQRGGIGFLLWNARNDYARPLAAMPAMTADPKRYFGKAEPTELAHIPASKPAPRKIAPPVPTPVAPRPASVATSPTF